MTVRSIALFLRRSLVEIGICGLALFTGACAPDLVSGRLGAFDEVVFGRSANGPIVDRLARWRNPVRIAVRGRPRGDHGSRLDRVLAVIDAATGHDIALVGNRATANVVLFFDDGAGYLAYLRERGGVEDPVRQAAIDADYCWATTWFAGDELIQAAGLIVDNGAWAESTGCLYHEMAHIMGLTYHPSDLYSILDHASNTDGLTTADRELLALLYDRRLFPGMARSEALRTARAILSGRGSRP